MKRKQFSCTTNRDQDRINAFLRELRGAPVGGHELVPVRSMDRVPPEVLFRAINRYVTISHGSQRIVAVFFAAASDEEEETYVTLRATKDDDGVHWLSFRSFQRNCYRTLMEHLRSGLVSRTWDVKQEFARYLEQETRQYFNL